jgi:hypothetical protein
MWEMDIDSILRILKREVSQHVVRSEMVQSDCPGTNTRGSLGCDSSRCKPYFTYLASHQLE